MGFWIATADATGARQANSELLLSPGPTRADYPQEVSGQILDTDDGRVIHQQPHLDGRRRTWEWVGYPLDQAGFRRVWPVLEGLRSRIRAEAGLSPYVWLKEDVSQGLRRWMTLTGTGTGSGFAFTDGSAAWATDTLVRGSVTVAGQIRAILANTATSLSVGDAFVGTPAGAYVIRYPANDWYRVRVLEVSRKVIESGGTVRYPSARIVFVVDDPNSVHLLD